jgi:hypothetical protein
MTSALTLEIARSSLRPVQDALRNQERRFARQDVWELLEACKIQASVAEMTWEVFQGFIEFGAEGRSLCASAKEAKEALAQTLETFSQAREVASGKTPRHGVREDDLLLILEDAARRVRQIREKFVSLLERIDVLPPPLDPAKLTGAGNYVGSDEFLAQLKGGDP